MTIQDRDAYAEGARTARKAIAEGVPRWMQTSDVPSGQFIDPSTGLPIAGLSAPSELAVWQASYARGFNDEIANALKLGAVTVDFRPLLMTRPEVVHAMSIDMLGTLSTDNPRLDAHDGDFSLELRVPKSTAKTKHTWIHYSRSSGEEWLKFMLYDGPLDVAVGRKGRVLVFKTSCLFLTRDVETTQVLNSYPV